MDTGSKLVIEELLKDNRIDPSKENCYIFRFAAKSGKKIFLFILVNLLFL